MESASSLDSLAAGLQGLGHPIRLQALVLLEFESTPRDLAEVLEQPLGVVAYHVRMLASYGMAVCVRTEPRRGAVAHFYRRTPLADELLGKLNGTLDIPVRKSGRPGKARRAALAEWVHEQSAPSV